MNTDTAAFIRQHSMISPGEGVVCALSGGADSVCLLDILASLQNDLGFKLYACHYNHNLRGEESHRDETFVRNLCKTIDVPLYVGSGDVSAQAAETGCGIEETARKMRYAFFDEALSHFGADRIATAHNADDNLETVIMHLARGTGLRGLCGIPPVRDRLIRPILFAPRTMIEQYCISRGLDHVEDSTNCDESYTRNRIRARVLPVLKEINPSAPEASVEMCTHLREDEKYLSDLSSADDRVCISSLGSRPVGIRTVRNAYERISGGLSLSSRQLDGLWKICTCDNPSAKLSLPGNITAARRYDELLFLKENAEPEDFCIELPENGSADTGEFLIFCKMCSKTPDLAKNTNTFAIKRDMIDGALYVRSRKTGDRIKLPGRPSKSLKKLFIDEKIPAADRSTVPVIADACSVAAVYGFGVDERYLAVDGDEVLEITITEKQ
ncbi:MAG: tRNA lysidine(34) synthetase TilS [Ruminococcaceae bacterium]|nr:tRNA lysidine(34) synthetase TilS [Oscillospiraceae bacterium]